MLEREKPYMFGYVNLLLAIAFTSLNHVQFERTPTAIEKNLSSVLVINSRGGNQNDSSGFVPASSNNQARSGSNGQSSTGSNNQSSQPKNTDNSGPKYQNNNDKPRYPWGVDPYYKPGGSGSALYDNEIPEKGEWISDPYIWDKVEENDSEDKEIRAPGKSQLDVDFRYEYDSDGNPTLLVPNIAKARTKRDYTRVEHEQTAAHMHHAPDLGISLPANFDMTKYENLDRAGKIAYAKEKLPPETIIAYQNEIAKSMSPLFRTKKTIAIPGFAGKHKQNTELTIQTTDIPNRTILSIVREDGVHISSFSLNNRDVRKLLESDFWVLKNRNL